MNFDPSGTRNDICQKIRERLIFLEKYSIDNKTYLIVPKNHSEFEFPFNLKDRVEYIKNKLKDYKVNVKKEDNGVFDGIRNKKYPKYTITVDDNLDKDLANSFKFTLSGKKYFIGKMSYDEWYLEPYRKGRTERGTFDENTLWERYDTVEIVQLFVDNNLIEIKAK